MNGKQWRPGKFEPGHEKTCLQGFRLNKTQTGLLSYKDQLESWDFGLSKYKYYSLWVANYKDADQTVWMRRLVCTFVVHIWLKQVFSCSGWFRSGCAVFAQPCICPNTVMILSFRTCMPGQTVQTQIRLLLEEQSDQGLHCLQFPLHFLDALLEGNAILFNF